MTQVTGIVAEVNNLGKAKGSNIVVNGQKYGCYDPVATGLDTLRAGMEVTFGTMVKGQYTNIQGTVTPTGGTGPVPAPAPAPSGGSGGGWKGKGSFKAFPIPALDGQRSIIRQNSLSHATAVVNAHFGGLEPQHVPDLDARASEVLRIAAMFEDYSAGDDIARAADEALAAQTAQ
jgi:hypothetical protein